MSGKPFKYSISLTGQTIAPDGNPVTCDRCGADSELQVAWNGPADPGVTVACPSGHMSVTNRITGHDAMRAYLHLASENR